MTEHDGGNDNRNLGIEPSAERSTLGRRAAHERLSTGALARWTRACATHPWRVVFGWLGIFALLVVLVATVGGSLRDEFEIPGSDTQKAIDLIEAEFASEQGGVLNVVFAAPEGERLDTPERQRGDRGGHRAPEVAGVQANGRQGRPGKRRRPVQRGHVLRRRPHRLHRGAVQRDDRGRGPRSGRRRAGCGPRDGRAGRRDGGVQRRRRVPAARAGDVRGARPARGDHRAAPRVPHLRGDDHPDRAGDRGAGNGVPAPLHPRRLPTSTRSRRSWSR